MIRLYTALQMKLLKAKSRAHLVAVKKQVTKKGKVYTQTFWTKPGEDAPAPKAAHMQEHVEIIQDGVLRILTDEEADPPDISPKALREMDESIKQWAKKYKIPIGTPDFKFSSYATIREGLGETGSMLLSMSYTRDADPVEYKQMRMSSIDAIIKDRNAATKPITWKNPKTHVTWDRKALMHLGDWVKNYSASVSTARIVGKLYDIHKSVGSDEDFVYENRKFSEYMAITMVTKAAPYTATGALYRGVRNTDWNKVKPGDVMPFAFGSFSKSAEAAASFANDYQSVVLRMSVPKDKSAPPIMGIDIDDIINQATDMDDSTLYDVLEATGVSKHQIEEEVIVRSPNLRVIKTEQVGEVVYVDVAPESLQTIKKAMDDKEHARILKSVETEFDSPLHRKKKLEKAKAGLVAIKKQVTKKGKIYTQTFWVRPEDAPKSKPIKIAKPSEVKTPRPTAAPVDPTVPKEVKEIPNNYKDGFYIQYRVSGVQRASKMAPAAIEKVFQLQGQTWVIHREIDFDGDRFLPKLIVSEASTGMRAFGEYQNESNINVLLAAFTFMVNGVEKTSPGKTAGLIEKAEKLPNLEGSSLDFTGFKMVMPADDATIRDLVRDIQAFLPEEDYIQNSTIEYWIRNYMDTEDSDQINLDVIKNDYDYEELTYAINNGMDLDESARVLVEVKGLMKQMFADSSQTVAGDMTVQSFTNWVTNDTTLDIADMPSYDFAVGDSWTHEAVMITAWNDKIDPAIHYQELLESETVNDEYDSEENFDSDEYTGDDQFVEINTSYETTLDYDDLELLGRWVTGEVRINRDAVKEYDSKRRSGIDVEKTTGFVDLMDRQSRKYSGDVLYRGTNNIDWGDLEPGNIKTIGMVSASRSFDKAKNFRTTEGWILEIHHSDTAPIYGVDILDILHTGSDQDADGVLHRLRVDTYEEEEEFIVRCPSFRVVSKHPESRMIIVEPAEMEILDLMKSMFEIDPELEAKLEESLNQPLHRPPEKAKGKKK